MPRATAEIRGSATWVALDARGRGNSCDGTTAQAAAEVVEGRRTGAPR